MEGHEVIEGIALVSKVAFTMNALEPKLLWKEYKMVGGIICLVAIVFPGTGVYKPSSLLIRKQHWQRVT